MQIILDNFLDHNRLIAITDALQDSDLFEDGRKTAGSSAKRVKQNLQARRDVLETRGAIAMIEEALLKHPTVAAAVLPGRIARILFNRHEPGMEYGAHVDDPLIAGVRTDISFTLFLSEPDSYDGGELLLHKYDGEERIKLAAGSMILYPSTSLHAVAPVSRGLRLAAIGWIESRVRGAEQREILFDLHNALANLPDTEANRTGRLALLKARYNLMRRWAD